MAETGNWMTMQRQLERHCNDRAGAKSRQSQLLIDKFVIVVIVDQQYLSGSSVGPPQGPIPPGWGSTSGATTIKLKPIKSNLQFLVYL